MLVRMNIEIRLEELTLMIVLTVSSSEDLALDKKFIALTKSN